MPNFTFCKNYWVLEFDHLQTGLFVDNSTVKEIVKAKEKGETVLWVTDVYNVDFLVDPTKLFLAHETSPETRHLYRLHNEQIKLEMQELGPWNSDES